MKDDNFTVSLEQLLPTLLQIFLTMLLGWVTGYYKIIGNSEARGLNIFVGKYSLPSLIFISLATFDFSKINIAFLLGIFTAKVMVFAFIIIVEIVLTRDFSKAAVYAIFCTQTNDFGMGLPLLDAVFGKNHVYVSYLYLAAPISLLVLNPIGFIMLEASKKTEGKKSIFRSLLLVVKGLVVNPIVSMTFMGVVFNLVFQGHPPEVLKILLEKLGAAFGACAPFTLGLSMVGKFQHIRGRNMPTLFGLMIVKCILSPITTHCMVGKIHKALYGYVDRGLVNFSFLYGTFPTALGVMSYANQYNISSELVSAGIVLCTIVSAPLMYLSAQILKILKCTVHDQTLLDNMKILDFNVALASVSGVLIILLIFIVSKKFMFMPHIITTSILLQSMVAPTSAILLRSDVISCEWQKFLHDFGVLSVQITSAFLAIELIMIIKRKPMKRFVQIMFVLIGPMLSLLVMLLLNIHKLSVNGFGFQSKETLAHDTSRNIAMVTINIMALLVTSFSLLFIYRTIKINKVCSCSSTFCEFSSENSSISEYSLESNGSKQTLTKCKVSLCELSTDQDNCHSPQIFRHSLLLMLMCCSMIAGLTLPLWRLLTQQLETDTGAYKVMLALNMVLSTGQGLLVFSIFILDCEYILNPVKNAFIWLKEKVKGEKENFPVLSAFFPDRN